MVTLLIHSHGIMTQNLHCNLRGKDCTWTLVRVRERERAPAYGRSSKGCENMLMHLGCPFETLYPFEFTIFAGLLQGSSKFQGNPAFQGWRHANHACKRAPKKSLMSLPCSEWGWTYFSLGLQWFRDSSSESIIEARGVCLSVGHGAPLGPSSTNCFAGRCLPFFGHYKNSRPGESVLHALGIWHRHVSSLHGLYGHQLLQALTPDFSSRVLATNRKSKCLPKQDETKYGKSFCHAWLHYCLGTNGFICWGWICLTLFIIGHKAANKLLQRVSKIFGWKMLEVCWTKDSGVPLYRSPKRTLPGDDGLIRLCHGSFDHRAVNRFVHSIFELRRPWRDPSSCAVCALA